MPLGTPPGGAGPPETGQQSGPPILSGGAEPFPRDPWLLPATFAPSPVPGVGTTPEGAAVLVAIGSGYQTAEDRLQRTLAGTTLDGLGEPVTVGTPVVF